MSFLDATSAFTIDLSKHSLLAVTDRQAAVERYIFYGRFLLPGRIQIASDVAAHLETANFDTSILIIPNKGCQRDPICKLVYSIPPRPQKRTGSDTVLYRLAL